jgi:DNA-3-methyladenine glycosylase II
VTFSSLVFGIPFDIPCSLILVSCSLLFVVCSLLFVLIGAWGKKRNQTKKSPCSLLPFCFNYEHSGITMKHLTILSQDKKLCTILDIVTPYRPQKQRDIYFRLMRAIAGQQLSVKAASTIWERFINLFPEQYPHPALVLAIDVERMRQAGLSYQKAAYMKNIADFSLQNDISFDRINLMGNDEIIEYLTSIKGVGQWTVEMLLMFSLGRKDVFPADDLGIINAMKKLYNLRVTGKALRTRCIKISENWRPYRSYACFYLWPYKNSF